MSNYQDDDINAFLMFIICLLVINLGALTLFLWKPRKNYVVAASSMILFLWTTLWGAGSYFEAVEAYKEITIGNHIFLNFVALLFWLKQRISAHRPTPQQNMEILVWFALFIVSLVEMKLFRDSSYEEFKKKDRWFALYYSGMSILENFLSKYLELRAFWRKPRYLIRMEEMFDDFVVGFLAEHGRTGASVVSRPPPTFSKHYDIFLKNAEPLMKKGSMKA